MEKVQIRRCPGCGGRNSRIKFIETPFVIVKCKMCSLVFLGNPPPDERLYDDYYDTCEPQPEQYSGNAADYQLRELYAINEQRIAYIKHFKPRGTLLDIGCGRGQFLKTARDHGFETFGIDISSQAVSYARNKFGLDAEVGVPEKIAASNKQFDIITLWHVLEHFIDPYEVLEHINKLLKDGGIVLVEVPNLYSLKFILSNTKWEGGNHPLYHRTFFTAATLREALLRSGFSELKRPRLTYRVPGRSRGYEIFKRILNEAAMDSFLNFVAWKKGRV